MYRATMLASFIGSLAAAAWLFGWNHPFHAAVGGAVLAGIAAIGLLARRRLGRRREDAEFAGDEDAAPQPIPRAVAFGGAAAAMVACALAGAFFVAARVPAVTALFYDWDRTELEAELMTLEEAGNYERAAELIERRLSEDLSPDWKRSLAERLYRLLVVAARRQELPTARIVLVRRAADVAEAHGLDSQLAELVLRESSREQRFAQQVEEFRQGKRWTDLVTLLCGAMLEEPADEWRHPLAAWLFEALVAAGRATVAEDEQVRNFSDAVAVAKQHGLEPEPAATLLKAVQTKIEARKQTRRRAEQLREHAAQERLERHLPIALAKGARAAILQCSRESYAPFLVIDIVVDDATGAAVRNLKSKDFRVTLGGKLVEGTIVARVEEQPPMQHVVLCIDVSKSVEGNPLAQTKRGGRAFCTVLAQTPVTVEVVSFGSEARRVCPWTTDLNLAATMIDELVASGQTALFDAIALALDDLGGRPAPRKVLLFTDGRRTVGRNDGKELIARCKREGVAVDVIGLASGDLDRATTEAIARDSGGQFVECRSEQEIVEHYTKAAQRVRREFYRIIVAIDHIPFDRPESVSLVVEVGRGNPATASATVNPGVGMPSVAARQRLAPVSEK